MYFYNLVIFFILIIVNYIANILLYIIYYICNNLENLFILVEVVKVE